MKKIWPLFLLLAACQFWEDGSAEEAWPQSELREDDLGFGPAYVLRISDYAPRDTAFGYAVQLSQGSRVWLDTQYLDLSGGDTVFTELVFSLAGDSLAVEPEWQIERFAAQ